LLFKIFGSLAIRAGATSYASWMAGYLACDKLTDVTLLARLAIAAIRFTARINPKWSDLVTIEGKQFLSDMNQGIHNSSHGNCRSRNQP